MDDQYKPVKALLVFINNILFYRNISTDCLKVFDGINRPQRFMNAAEDDAGNLLRLRGPGTLFIKCSCVFFQQFAINPAVHN